MMKCPTCVEEGEKSQVYLGGTCTTSMGYSSYYDEGGIFHSHDPNKQTTKYSCSRRHKWSKSSTFPCPAKGCTWKSHLAESDSRLSEGIL